MAGGRLAVADDRTDEIAVAAFREEIDFRCRAIAAAEDVAQIDRGAEMAAVGADQDQLIAFGCAADAGHRLPVGQQADAGDRRRRQDRDAVGLVVERDVAGDDREIERAAGLADALHGLDELAHDFRLLRIAEIEVVGRCQRLGARRGDIAPAFGDGLLAAFERASAST